MKLKSIKRDLFLVLLVLFAIHKDTTKYVFHNIKKSKLLQLFTECLIRKKKEHTQQQLAKHKENYREILKNANFPPKLNKDLFQYFFNGIKR